MQLTFLQTGDTHPRNKVLDPQDKTISVDIQIDDIDQFYIALCGCSSAGRQLLRGALQRPIDDEAWGDKYNKYSQLHFLSFAATTLPPALENTSHIMQILGNTYRYYFMLSTPIAAHALAHYVTTLSDLDNTSQVICNTDSDDIELVKRTHEELTLPEEILAELKDIPQPALPPVDIPPWLVFNHRLSDKYYAGEIDVATGTHSFYTVSSKQKLDNFLKLRGGDTKAPVEEWDMSFQPTSKTFIDVENKHINTFKPSEYMRNAEIAEGLVIPPRIDAILNSLTNNDTEIKEHFINWVAFKFQTRDKAGTAWVFTGEEGTGKGILHDKILTPLFSPDHCEMVTISDLREGFNAYQEQALLITLDEAHVDNDRAGTAILNRMKNCITEPTIQIRKMYTNLYSVKNYCDYLFFSNHRDVMRISDSDRRYNIAPHQTKVMKIPTDAEMDELRAELQDFANYLASYAVNEMRAHTAMNNEHKSDMATSSATQHEQFFRALKHCNIEYFVEALEDPHPDFKYLRADSQKIITTMIESAGSYEHDDTTFINTKDISTLYAISLGKQEGSRQVKAWLLHNGFPPVPHRPRIEGTRQRGYYLPFHYSAEEKAAFTDDLKESPPSNVTPITRTP